MNITHQQKKLPIDTLKKFRDQFRLPIADDRLVDVPYLTFEEGSKELEYMRARRQDLGGYLPARREKAESLPVPELSAFEPLLKGTGEGREISTTMAFVRILNILLKDKALGKRIVPIVPDESRTFGMEGLFRQIGIWNQEGQKYVPEDSDQLMFYRESETGQILQEGINEAGGMCDWIAAATSYSTHGEIMIPFYIFYSMFGFQRIGDLAWAAGDMRSRGFLLGGTAGRTTLNGEGLQHEDGHSLLWAASVPNCVSYDPTFGYELAVIMQDGLRRMVADQEDVYYYITVMNENYEHPAIPQGDAVAAGHHQGHVLVQEGRSRQEGAARSADGRGHDLQRSDRRRRPAEERLGRRRRPVERAELHGTGARRPRRASAGTCCIRPKRRSVSHVDEAAEGREGPGDRIDGLHPRARRPDPRVRAAEVRRARHRRLSAARTRARRCATSSKSTATGSRLPR